MANGSPTSGCSGKVRLHVIEEMSLPGTAYSAIPPSGRFISGQMHTAKFHDARSLERCVFDAIGRMHQPVPGTAWSVIANVEADADAPRHLLVISSHGRERTGTELSAKSESINAHLIDQRLFQIRPENLVVFLSACWGAYPSFVQAARSGDWRVPTVIGAIVPIHPRDANMLQKQIVRVLCETGHSEAALMCLVRKTNRRLRGRYPADPFRIVLRSGKSYPREGSAGLAAPILRVREFMVVALQNWSAGQPTCAVLLGADGRYRFTSVNILPASAATGYCFSATAKSLWFDEMRGIGALCDVGTPSATSASPRFFEAYKPPFPHAQAVPAATGPGRMMPLDALPTCKRCNWARMSCQRQKRNGATDFKWALQCTYDGHCPKH